MPSKIHRRSGRAVTEYCNLIEFTPDLVCLVGVGIRFAEVECMTEAWGDFELYGFEPHPDTYKSVFESFPGRFYPYAVSDHNGRETLYSKPRHKDGASVFPKIIEKDRLECEEFEVDTTTLDHMFKGIQTEFRKGLLWLDCEGCEEAALKGGKSFIDQSISVVNVELTGKPRGEGWCKPVDVHRKLVEYGFLQGWSHTNRVYTGQCDVIYVRPEVFKPEYCSAQNSVLEYEKWVKNSEASISFP